jgi:two-component system sensor histidine kinase CpxA
LQLSIGIALQQNEFDMSANMLAALHRIEKESLQIEDMIAQVLLLSRLDNQQPLQNLETVSLKYIMTPIIARFSIRSWAKT